VPLRGKLITRIESLAILNSGSRPMVSHLYRPTAHH